MIITQTDALKAARIYLDDQKDGKTLFQYRPLQGVQDGTNRVFQIPQPRIVPETILLYKNLVDLILNTGFTVTDQMRGLLNLVVAPTVTDSLTATFSFVWFTDSELDSILNRSANENGFSAYYTSSSGISGAESVATLPTDIPDGLYNAILLLGSAKAASLLVTRFATKYDVSAGDQNWTPSSMAEAYDTLADRLEKSGLNARDDYYKGQGRQYRPAVASQGWVLPSHTPKR